MTLDRAALIIALGVVLIGPMAAAAQQPARTPRIGWLLPFAPPSQPSPIQEAFRIGLRELGYVEGQNLVIEYRYAAGSTERLSDLAVELVRLKVDVIFSVATEPTLAAKRATATIPIVFTNVGDPVGSGIVTSLARPGGNVTGLTHLSFELDAKRLELLKETIPSIARVGVLWNPDFSPHGGWLRSVEASARALHVGLQLLEFRKADDFARAVASASRGAGGLLIMPHPVAVDHAAQLAELVTRSRLPAIAHFREFAMAGGLMTYGASMPALFRHAATYVHRILKGAKPSDLPVEQPNTFELVINLKTAKALGLMIPQSVLVRADAVIE